MRQNSTNSGKSPGGNLRYLSPAGASPSNANPVFAAEKSLLTRMMRSIGNPPVQVVLWDGQEITNENGHAIARVLIRDRAALLKLIINPELYFGELYAAQRVEVQGNLLDFIDATYQVWPLRGPDTIERKILTLFNHAGQNTLHEARNNIHHHYDIGNDFYKLWLDEQMVYTCAYFPDPNMSLEQAQLAKLDHVCRKLRLQPGEKVVEAGCGWGALAIHLAKYYGVTVQAHNISTEQIAYARERARSEGLDQQVVFIEDDYRHVQGQFDAFVSVGMLEHVGVANYRELGAVIDRCLKPNGRGLIHTIGLNFPRPMDAWTERHIFPGANPPSLAEMMSIFEPYNFSVLDVENLRPHYAKTLEHWLHRFEENSAQVAEMFDNEFVRSWRLYLAGSLAAFKNGGMQLFQVAFNRAGNNQIPWSRQYLYEKGKRDANM
ncbi:MAG: cyclopropane-fatty-acyl-phospholipid synthase family protein [Pseudomonadota bacterium]